MWGLMIVVGIIAVILFVLYYNNRKNRKKIKNYLLPDRADAILTSMVAFYRLLTKEQKETFRERVRDFLARTKITGVGDTVVTDMDRLLIGASAIIPIFSFPDWRYNNLNEVLLVEGTFNKGDLNIDGSYQDLLGMVGSGAMQREMILSQKALRAGFAEPRDAHNTAIHEFVHLIDKADGATDGVPQYLLDKPYVAPWLQYMHQEINNIRNGYSDINPYATTSPAEFLAVVSEYFFERPFQLKAHHPQLYAMLKMMFMPEEQKK